jgi:mannose-1-phosphate guanylyltransferase
MYKDHSMYTHYLFAMVTCLLYGTTYAANHAVILAGGSGERLWPFSTQSIPKQLLSIHGKKTFLEQSIDRVDSVVEEENIWICATQSLHESIATLIKDRVGHIITEPERRDTAAAILYSCWIIAQHDPEATVLFIPSDAYIPESAYEVFRSSLESFYTHAQTYDGITLFGIKPTCPATGYGYIEHDLHANTNGYCLVTRFHEKPSESVAFDYFERANMLWNIGMFGGNVSYFLHAFALYAPDIYGALCAHCRDDAPYDAIRKISIDYALIEKIPFIQVLPVDFAWCDVGNLRVFLTLQERAASQQTDCVVSVDSDNNLVSASGLVTLVGVNNLCIVQKGNVLLIAHQDAVEKIKNLVYELKKSPETVSYT